MKVKSVIKAKSFLAAMVATALVITSIPSVSAMSEEVSAENTIFEEIHEGYSYEFDVLDYDYINNTFYGSISLRNHTTKPFDEWKISFDANFTIDNDEFVKTNTGYTYTGGASLLSNTPMQINFIGKLDSNIPNIEELHLYTEPIIYSNPIISNDDDEYPIFIDLKRNMANNDGVIINYKLKDSTQKYEIKITKVSDNSMILNDILENENNLSATLSLNEQYSFEYKSDIENIVGKFTIYKEDTYVISQYYDTIQNINAKASYISETESNDNLEDADSADNLFKTSGSNNTIITGTISNSSDIDYFEFTAPGNGFVTITLIVSGAYNYDLYAQTYIQGKLSYVGISTNAKGSSEIVRFAVNKGQKYYVKVVHASDPKDVGYQYKLHGAYNFTKAWFSQMRSYDNEIQYWNTDLLDKLYFNNGTKPFMINGTSWPKGDYMDEGCAIASIAMVLNNLNAKRTCTDFRLGTYMQQPADPFTVMMANIQKSTAPTYNSSSKEYNYTINSSLNHNPVYINASSKYSNNWSEISTKFGVGEFTSTTNISISNISLLLSQHPEGIIADVGNHYVVICGDRGSSYGNDRFYVCDAGSANAATGCYKPFSVRGKYNINSIKSIYYIQ